MTLARLGKTKRFFLMPLCRGGLDFEYGGDGRCVVSEEVEVPNVQVGMLVQVCGDVACSP